MNTVQFYDKIRQIDHLSKALDVYKKRRYPLDLSDTEYDLLKEALGSLEHDLYVSRAKSEVEVRE